jgi:5-methylcytosine-specific restriction protein A
MPTKAPTHRPFASTPRKPWAKDANAPKRVTGRKLQRLRKQLFERSPLCVECLKVGRTTAATQRDHVIALARGGTDDDANIQALCDDCHELKSRKDRQRG